MEDERVYKKYRHNAIFKIDTNLIEIEKVRAYAKFEPAYEFNNIHQFNGTCWISKLTKRTDTNTKYLQDVSLL